MRGYMFRNRWFALLFVGMVLAGAANIVGTEGSGGALDAAREQYAGEQAQTQVLATDHEPAADANDVLLEFTPDEELIDPATGYDPTPVDEFASAQPGGQVVVPDTQVVIVSHDDGQQSGQ